MYDNFGRQVGDGMNADDLKSLIGQLMRKPTGPHKPYKDESKEQTKKLEALREDFEKYTKEFKKESKEQQRFLQSVVANLRDLKNQRKTAHRQKANKEDAIASKALASLNKTFTKKGSGYTHDVYVVRELQKLNNAITRRLDRLGGGGGGGRGRGRGRSGRVQRNGVYQSDDLAIMQRFVWNTTDQLRTLEKGIMGFSALGTIFDDVIDKEREYIQNMRAIAHETTGATGANHDFLATYDKLSTTLGETGVDRTKLQQAMIKASKIGIKDQKTILGLTKAQLNAERQIGVEAGTLGDSFQEWTLAGRMNNMQIAQMGRSLRDVAKSTGLTGDNLASVVKSSEQWIKNLRSGATLTAQAAKSVIEISANAKKLGVEDSIAPILKALTNTNSLFFETSAQTQALMFSAAQMSGTMDKLQAGTLGGSKSGMQAFASGLENVMLNMMRDFGVSSLDQVDNLTDEAKKIINMRMKQAYGMELNEARGIFDAFKNANKGLGDQLKEIEAQRKKNLTLEEKAILLEKERTAKNSTAFQIITTLSEASKGAKDMNEAFQKFERNKADLSSDFEALGKGVWGDNKEVAKSTIQSAIETLNQGLSSVGKEKLTISNDDIALALSNKEEFSALTERLNSAQNILSTAQKEQMDPVTKMEGHLKQINDNIRSFVNSAFTSMFNSVLGELVVIGATLTAIAGGVALMAINTIAFKDTWNSTLEELMERNIAGRFASRFGMGGMNAAGGVHGTYGPALPPGFRNSPKQGLSGWIERLGTSIDDASKTASSQIKNASNTVANQSIRKTIADSWLKTFEWTKTGFKKAGDGFKFVGKKTGDLARGAFSRGAGYATRAGGAVRGAFSGGGGLTIRGMMEAAKALPSLFTKGLGGAFAALTRGAGMATASTLKLAASMNPVGLAITAVMLTAEGLVGAYNANARAAEIFGKKQEDLTLNQEYSAKAAGFLTGVLNGLTFGILGLLVPLDTWTDAIARFNAKVPVMTIVFGGIVAIFELIWGVIKGIGKAIWEIFSGLWDGVMNILTPIFEGVSDIFGAISDAFGVVEGDAGPLVKAFREMGGIVGIVSGAIGGLGKAIGWVFRAAGSIIGFVVKTIMKAIEGLMVMFEPIGEVFKEVGSAVGEIFGIFGDIFSVIGDLGKELYGAIIEPILGLFGGGDSKSFFEGVKSAAKILGKVVGSFLRVILFPLMVIVKVIGGIAKIIRGIIAFFRGDFKGAKELVSGAFKGIFDAVVNLFKGLPAEVAGWLIEIGKSIWNWLISIPKMLWNGLSDIVIAGKDLFIGGIQDYIISPLMKLADTFWGMVKWIANKFGFGPSEGDKLVEASTTTQKLEKQLMDSKVSNINSNNPQERLQQIRNELPGLIKQRDVAMTNSKPTGYQDPSGIGSGFSNWWSNDNISILEDQKKAQESVIMLNNKILDLQSEERKLSGKPVAKMNPIPNKSAIEKEIAKQKASNKANQTEIHSEDLASISSESTEQTSLLGEMLSRLDNISHALTSNGISVASSVSTPTSGKPANFYRRVNGNMAQNPGKAIVNIGAAALS